MIVTLLLLQLASAAWPIAEAPLQNTRARVALLLSDSDTSSGRWMSISQLDSLLPQHLAKRRIQYISRYDVLSFTDQDAGAPLTWTDEDAFALGALFRATFMVELRVSHTLAREDVCARVLRVHDRTMVDSVCVQNTGSMRRAISQLAPDLGRRLNRLSRVSAAPKRPHLTRVGADGAPGKRPRAATVETRIRVVRAPAPASI